MSFKTEDQVRDEAKSILKFDMEENDIKQGTGQITTFNQLGFKGIRISLMDGIFLKILMMLQLYWRQNQKIKI